MKRLFRIMMLPLFLIAGCTDSIAVLPAEKGEPGFNKDPRTDDLWIQVNASDDGFDTTYYFDFILSACHLGMDAKYIKVALQRFCDQQVKELPDLGKVPRTVGGDFSDVEPRQCGGQLFEYLYHAHVEYDCARGESAFGQDLGGRSQVDTGADCPEGICHVERVL